MEELSRRHKEIVQLMAEGKTNKQIALELNITERTVKNHAVEAFKRLDAGNRTEAVINAVKRGIITLGILIVMAIALSLLVVATGG